LGMILGAILLGSAIASARENTSRNEVIQRECTRYNLDYLETLRAMSGMDPEHPGKGRRWWDLLIMLAAIAFFVCFARTAAIPAIPMNHFWLIILTVVLLAVLIVGAWRLRHDTNFN
jgi:hypothetical protein